MKKLTMLVLLICLVMAASQVNAKKGGNGGGGGTDTGLISMIATGDSEQNFVVEAYQECQERIAADDTSYLCNKDGTGHEIAIGNFLMTHIYPNDSKAENCFGYR